MSRSTIANVLVGYFVVAFALAVFLEWGEPTPYVDLAARSGVVIGHTLGWYALAGILPLLIWAVFRFRAEKARGPIGLWGIIGAVLIFLSCYGEMASRKERIAAAFPMTGLSAQARADFIKNATIACVHRQKDGAINKEVGITVHQIDTYCKCYAETLLGLTTIEELRYFAQNASAPSGYGPKVQQAAAQCFAKQAPNDDEWEDVK